jgi:LTXXQ motif family protein
MTHSIALLCVATLACAAPGARAQHHTANTTTATTTATTPYAGEQARAIKSLAASDVAGLLAGQGMGLAKAAELNGYPGPMHTLELKAQLRLSAEQVAASQALMAAHKARARALGAELVAAEQQLDGLFAQKRGAGDVLSAAAVEQATRAVSGLQAQLRSEHLKTHLQQAALLSAEQIAQYSVLRGYSGGAGGVEGGTVHPGQSHH